MQQLQSLIQPILNIGTKYGVNPFVFAGIYIGAMPFFIMSIGLIVKYYKEGRSIIFPVSAAGFFFISAYIYLLFNGQNVPWWVYGVLVLMIVGGAYSTIKSTKKKINDN